MKKFKGFTEKKCTISHDGQKFTAGGAVLANCDDSYVRGIVYAKPEDHAVTDWHGKKLAPARFGPKYRGNYCKMQSVSFDYKGLTFTGRYCPDTSEAVRVKSTRPVK